MGLKWLQTSLRDHNVQNQVMHEHPNHQSSCKYEGTYELYFVRTSDGVSPGNPSRANIIPGIYYDLPEISYPVKQQQSFMSELGQVILLYIGRLHVRMVYRKGECNQVSSVRGGQLVKARYKNTAGVRGSRKACQPTLTLPPCLLVVPARRGNSSTDPCQKNASCSKDANTGGDEHGPTCFRTRVQQ